MGIQCAAERFSIERSEIIVKVEKNTYSKSIYRFFERIRYETNSVLFDNPCNSEFSESNGEKQ
jgi:hypothetical protein